MQLNVANEPALKLLLGFKAEIPNHDRRDGDVSMTFSTFRHDVVGAFKHCRRHPSLCLRPWPSSIPMLSAAFGNAFTSKPEW
jgi:hypothetical protein